MSRIKLRDYQEAAVESMLADWRAGGSHSLIVLPTGAGKSLVAAELMARLAQRGAQIALVTHVDKLITQNAAKLEEIHPEVPFGIYHAGLKQRNGGAPVVFAGIHSVWRKPEVIGKRHVILVDEAHLINHKDAGMYRKLFRHFEETVPGMRIGGLTATPYRLSTGRLDEDYGKHKALFEKVVYEEPITRLIERGYLNPVVPYVSPSQIDVSAVKVTGGDYNRRQLEETVNRDDINIRVADEIVRAGRDRYGWLVFAAGVDHAKRLTELLKEREIEAEYVIGEMSAAEKEAAYERCNRGVTRCLVGVNALTTGVDIPRIDLIACVRHTKSMGLWCQMIGRGVRLCEETGKQDCLLLDFTRNSLELGPIDQASGSKNAPVGKGDAPVRACPECQFVHHISQPNCPKCGHAYPAHEVKFISQSRAAAVLSTQREPAWFDVDTVSVVRHKSLSGFDSVRVNYVCGLKTFTHYLGFDNPKGKVLAQRWWRRNTWSGEAPESTDEALVRADDIRAPGRILVMPDGKYERIASYDYSVEGVQPLIEREIA